MCGGGRVLGTSVRITRFNTRTLGRTRVMCALGSRCNGMCTRNALTARSVPIKGLGHANDLRFPLASVRRTGGLGLRVHVAKARTMGS